VKFIFNMTVTIIFTVIMTLLIIKRNYIIFVENFGVTNFI